MRALRVQQELQASRAVEQGQWAQLVLVGFLRLVPAAQQQGTLALAELLAMQGLLGASQLQAQGVLLGTQAGAAPLGGQPYSTQAGAQLPPHRWQGGCQRLQGQQLPLAQPGQPPPLTPEKMPQKMEAWPQWSVTPALTAWQHPSVKQAQQVWLRLSARQLRPV